MVHALKLYLTVCSKRVGNRELQLLECVPCDVLYGVNEKYCHVG